MAKIKTLFELFIKCDRIITKYKYNKPCHYDKLGLYIINNNLLNYYINNDNDWHKFIYNINKGYISNEIFNDHETCINMSLISWSPKSFTPIHNHTHKSIFIPLLGNINHNIYNTYNYYKKDKCISEQVIREGFTYSYNSISFRHELFNNSNNNIYTLHIYDNEYTYL